MRALTRDSISVSRSASLMAGRVRSRTSKVTGRMDGKYRWKKMRFRTPGAGAGLVQFSGTILVMNGLRRGEYRAQEGRNGLLEHSFRRVLPLSTSRTVLVSAKISRKYSGGVLRGSIPAPRWNESRATGRCYGELGGLAGGQGSMYSATARLYFRSWELGEDGVEGWAGDLMTVIELIIGAAAECLVAS